MATYLVAKSLSALPGQIPQSHIECVSSSGKTKVYIYDLSGNKFKDGQFGSLAAEIIVGVRMIGLSTPDYTVNAQSTQDFYDTWLSSKATIPFHWRSAIGFHRWITI